MNQANISIALTFLLALAVCGSAQNIAGKYEGLANVVPFGQLPIKAEMRERNGKVSGSFETPLGAATIIEGVYSDGILKLIIDAGGGDINFNGKFDEGKLKFERMY